MKRILMIMILAVAAAAPSHAQSLHTWSRITLFGGTAFDLTTTQIALNRGFREFNPLAGQNHAVRNGVSVGITFALDEVGNREYKRSGSKTATIANFTLGLLRAALGTRNAIVMSRHKN